MKILIKYISRNYTIDFIQYHNKILLSSIKIKQLIEILTIAIIFTIISCSGKKNEQDIEVKVKPEVIVVNPDYQNMVDFITLNGNTYFQNYEDIRATFSGYIEKLSKNIGDSINTGDNIFVLRTKEAVILDSFKSNSSISTGKGLVRINAKTRGNLIKFLKHTGDYVLDGDELAQIASPQSMKISLNVPFRIMELVKNTNNFIIYLPDGRQFNAKLGNILPSVDQTAQTQTVLLTLQGKVILPDSLNVTVRIPRSSISAAVVLPKSAVQSNETMTEFWVMKVINDSIAVKIKIKKGIENSEFVSIIEPVLDFKDKFVVEGAYGLEDSTKVKIITR